MSIINLAANNTLVLDGLHFIDGFGGLHVDREQDDLFGSLATARTREALEETIAESD